MFRERAAIVALIAIVFCGDPTAARADLVSAELRDSVGDVTSTSVVAGSFFDVFVELTITGSPLTAGQFQIGSYDAVDGLFTVNSVTFGPGWSNDPNFTLNPAPQTLGAANSYRTSDIGSIAEDLVIGVGPGTRVMATLQIGVSNAAVLGDYRLFVGSLNFGNLAFDPVQTESSEGGYRVSVIPAPGAALLGVIGLVLVGRRRTA